MSTKRKTLQGRLDWNSTLLTKLARLLYTVDRAELGCSTLGLAAITQSMSPHQDEVFLSRRHLILLFYSCNYLARHFVDRKRSVGRERFYSCLILIYFAMEKSCSDSYWPAVGPPHIRRRAWARKRALMRTKYTKKDNQQNAFSSKSDTMRRDARHHRYSFMSLP